MDWDSSEETRDGESFRGRGILVTIAFVTREGGLEEAPKEIQENEERNCDIKGRVELGMGEGCIPKEAIASGGIVGLPRGVSRPCSMSGPM